MNIMNVTEDICAPLYGSTFDLLESNLENVYSNPHSLKVYDTYQFTDYSKYENYAFDPELKAKRKEIHFPIDLKDAYGLGVKIAQDSLKI